jgi:hypothetical protein
MFQFHHQTTLSLTFFSHFDTFLTQDNIFLQAQLLDEECIFARTVPQVRIVPFHICYVYFLQYNSSLRDY